jgi:chorismate dehydratase
MDCIRVACVRYLNTLPLIHGLDKLPGVELVPTVPSRIAAMVRCGEADLGLVSLADAAQDSGSPLALLPVGMIGCEGPTLTVRLFSRVPLARITAVHADTDSRTSVVLCQLVLRRLHGLRPAVVPFDTYAQPDAETRPETVLLIGDKVVTDPPPEDRYPHQLDLGQAWHELTGLPFAYAVWACRATETESPGIRSAAALLDRQRRRNMLRLDWIAERFAPEHKWPGDLARRYLGSLLRFDPGPREREAAERFVSSASDLELMTPGPLRWCDVLAGVENPVPAA